MATVEQPFNPYVDEFERLVVQSNFRGQTWFGERKDLVEEYSWAIPNKEVLEYLSNFDSIIEVGAGNGYWAKCINERGGNVRATDANPPEETYVEVDKRSDYDLDLASEVVLMVWPPVNSSMAHGVLTQEPNHVLYVGEQEGGCTGGSQFFSTLDQKYGLVETIDIPSFEGVDDKFYHFFKKR